MVLLDRRLDRGILVLISLSLPSLSWLRTHLGEIDETTSFLYCIVVCCRAVIRSGFLSSSAIDSGTIPRNGTIRFIFGWEYESKCINHCEYGCPYQESWRRMGF